MMEDNLSSKGVDALNGEELKALRDLELTDGFLILEGLKGDIKRYLEEISLKEANFTQEYLVIANTRKSILLAWDTERAMIEKAKKLLEKQEAGGKKIVGKNKLEDMVKYKIDK
jgi:hypothetical protein